ncbi:hypothetical protein FIB66_27225 [Escherichia coli]|nr:hypothetical protein FIC16_23015 [Escherichia coli]TNS82185.1 hypothetical protein FIC09_24980 [Escherichia coli]TNT07036.1 hypothetical protein FIC03_26475 [Escherichia coli]TNU06601.1 hypothetical protein FIB79_17950 [Escherichia coli]TNU46426.1 hypothetical protein FIB66_27225 [Escherichia coli]
MDIQIVKEHAGRLSVSGARPHVAACWSPFLIHPLMEDKIIVVLVGSVQQVLPFKPVNPEWIVFSINIAIHIQVVFAVCP